MGDADVIVLYWAEQESMSNAPHYCAKTALVSATEIRKWLTLFSAMVFRMLLLGVMGVKQQRMLLNVLIIRANNKTLFALASHERKP